jgi:HlyD family secretion protein
LSRKTKIVVVVVVVAAQAGIGWTVLSKGKTDSAAFATAVVDRGTVIQSVNTTGTLTAVTTVKVGSQVSGIIATLHADFNNKVHKSQVLATLDPVPFEAAVNQNKAQLERTKVGAQDALSKLKRQKALFEANLVSEDQLDSATATYNQAVAQVTELTAALDRALTNLQYSIIRSPIDGVVVSRDYDVGQTVAASFQAPTLFTIAEDLTRMQLTCDVDEADIGQVKVGVAVTFRVDSFPEKDFLGKVAQIRLAPKTQNNVVTYPVIVEVDNRDMVLLPGMTAEVRIQVARVEGVLRVASAALRVRPELVGADGGGGRGGGMGRPPSGGPQGGRMGWQEPSPASLGRPPEERVRTARVFVLAGPPGAQPRPIQFKPGLTDGQFVEVKEGGIEEGMKVIVGLATAQGQDAGGLMNMMGPRRGR